MKRQNAIIVVLVALLAAAGIWWYVDYGSSRSTTNTNPTNATTINIPTELPDRVSYQGQDGKSALDLLKESHEVIESDGFVQSIDGRTNSKTTFWLYYVNGQPGDVGAKDYVTKSSDTIEWKYEQAQ